LPKISLGISARHYKAAKELALLYKKPVIQWLTEELETEIENYKEMAETMGEVLQERIAVILGGLESK
jgi:hypothetical protein